MTSKSQVHLLQISTRIKNCVNVELSHMCLGCNCSKHDTTVSDVVYFLYYSTSLTE